MQWQEIPAPTHLETGNRYRLTGSAPGLATLDAGKLRAVVVEFKRADVSLMKPLGPRFAVLDYGVIPETSEWQVTIQYTHDTRNWAQADMRLPSGATGNTFSALFLAAGSIAGVWLQAEALEVAVTPVNGDTETGGGIIGRALWLPVAAIGGYYILKWWKGK